MASGDPIKILADQLAKQGGLKLWSLIATILGDLSQAGCDQLAGTELTRIMERVGLQPQAMRVALHRLKRDGWIESTRDGRVSYHGLSETGRAQTLSVRERVYGAAMVPAINWRFAVLPDDGEVLLHDLSHHALVFPVTPRTAFVADGERALPDTCFYMGTEQARRPDWLLEKLKSDACDALYADHSEMIDALNKSTLPENAFDRWVLRILVLHAWRRLVLRSNRVAELLLSEKGAWFQARQSNNRLLDQLEISLPSSTVVDLAQRRAEA